MKRVFAVEFPIPRFSPVPQGLRPHYYGSKKGYNRDCNPGITSFSGVSPRFFSFKKNPVSPQPWLPSCTCCHCCTLLFACFTNVTLTPRVIGRKTSSLHGRGSVKRFLKFESSIHKVPQEKVLHPKNGKWRGTMWRFHQKCSSALGESHLYQFSSSFGKTNFFLDFFPP